MRFHLFFFYFLCVSLNSLPPYITLEERIQESPVVIKGKISIIKERQLFSDTKYLTVLVNLEKIYKNFNRIYIPKTFYLYLNIYPETFENKLKFTPEEGVFIIFLEPIVSDTEIIVFKLYKEEPFALENWTEEKENTIITYLNRGGL